VRHLASFGAQAALVADSSYYKLLIGRVRRGLALPCMQVCL
jgi:hypothetical protein